MAPVNSKRRLVVSFHNLPTELQEQVKALYPLGYSDAMIRVDKPNGDFFYAVPFETADTSYLVKIDVKIDDMSEEEEDKEFYEGDDLKGADELQDDESDMEDEPADDGADFGDAAL